MTTTKYAIPAGEKCYACDAKPAGVTLHNGRHLEAACKRHADPTMPAEYRCMYCDGPLRNGSLDLGEGIHAHAKCHRAEMAV